MQGFAHSEPVLGLQQTLHLLTLAVPALPVRFFTFCMLLRLFLP